LVAGSGLDGRASGDDTAAESIKKDEIFFRVIVMLAGKSGDLGKR
jgi:hypothetical protein